MLNRLYVKKKISKNICIICKLRSILPEKELFMLYNCLILPYLQYCNITWASVGKTKLDNLYKLQKKALRICTNSNYKAHSLPLFFRLNTLNIYDIHKIRIATLMYCVFNDLSPKNIYKMFLCNNLVHPYNTRSSNKYHYHKVNTYLRSCCDFKDHVRNISYGRRFTISCSIHIMGICSSNQHY